MIGQFTNHLSAGTYYFTMWQTSQAYSSSWRLGTDEHTVHGSLEDLHDYIRDYCPQYGGTWWRVALCLEITISESGAIAALPLEIDTMAILERDE